jgi:hypothetical protein
LFNLSALRMSLRKSSVRGGALPSNNAPAFRRSRGGTRHRFHPMAQLQNRVSRGGGWREFCPLRQNMPRLSTLRADRSSCRSTGDPEPPGSGWQKSARGDRISLRCYGMPSGTAPLNERDGSGYRHRHGEVKGIGIFADETTRFASCVWLETRGTRMILIAATLLSPPARSTGRFSRARKARCAGRSGRSNRAPRAGQSRRATEVRIPRETCSRVVL